MQHSVFAQPAHSLPATVTETLSEGQTRSIQEVQYPPRTDNKEALSHELVLQLVMGHLAACGRTKTVKSIEEETGTMCMYTHSNTDTDA